MPKLTGIFSNFKDLDKIPIADISRWLKSQDKVRTLEDFVANRMLYPQTVPITSSDMEVDFAIFREAITRQPNLVYSESQNTIFITHELVIRFPPLDKLLNVIVKSVSIRGVAKIVLKEQKNTNVLGSIVSLPLPQGDQVTVVVGGKSMNLKVGIVDIIHITKPKIDLKIGENPLVMAYGGKVGVIIDLRRK